MNYLSKFLYVISAKKIELVLLLLAFLTVSIMDALGIGLVGPFMGLATNPELIHKNLWLANTYKALNLKSTNQFIGLLGLTIVAIFYLKSFFYYQIQRYVFRFCFTQQVKLRLRLLHTYLFLPYTFHLKTNSAHLIQNIINESQSFSYSVAIPLLNSISNSFVLVVLVLLLAKTDLAATVSVIGILLGTYLPFHFFRHKIVRWGKEGVDANTEMLRIVNHAIGGLKETRVIGCEEFFENQLGGQVNRFARVATLFHVFQMLPRIVIESLLITFVVGLVSVSLLFEQRSQNLVSVLGIFAIASIRLLPSASQLMSNMGVLRNFKPTLERLYMDLKEIEKPESVNYLKISQGVLLSKGLKFENQKANKNTTMPFTENIVLDKINYAYPESNSNSLTDVSLTIKKGESIALIGKSGAGKTTLVDVLLGLLIPQSGDIRVDNLSIYNSLRSWQNLIGYIPQTIFLTDDTIERNIAFGVSDDKIDRQRLDNAIRSAQLTELIAQLPEGTQTMVGEHGVRLSGGQRQRIGIARALYHEREILVLDEATSALDNETENLISQAIQDLSGTKTMIIIAHRLTTVEHCDRIYEMQKGQIIKCGSYQEVVLAQNV
ncbi:ABC transporter ATP-binding protein [[Phormidium ambiguum] IAM M-71]|uniref:ABC transporter ATP-binding protein n=1 Tax=[Phormidium ambiguum] IAM M-71 TaxID=454136 RepID=A0A1U7IL57_9CYAN|nr:ABC transporter ATP-binding protein [Phormidium ambiguum]OKH37905.1 ABC transporter ATP-binding protein [Phormidium ambiguum IAM M-71]